MGEFWRPGKCECCHREGPTGVASSAFGAVSHAYCLECFQKPAEPLYMFVYLLDDVAGGDPSKLTPEMKNWYTWIDGRYVHWSNFVIMWREGKINVAR